MTNRGWNPQKTKVFTLGLGLEEWYDPKDPVGHRDVVVHDFFKINGVPKEHNIHIRDNGGTREDLMQTLPDFLSDSDEDTLVIFYYAGHGDIMEEGESDYDYDLYFCHPSDDSFTLGDFVDLVEEYFEGSNVLMIADCCYSGNVARLASTIDSDYNYAGLTSSLATKSSTGNWTFSDCLLEALLGKANIDYDQDGTISLKELSDYIKEQMKELEDQKSDFGYSKDFDHEIRLAVVSK